LNPFDIKSVLLAKHAQHVVLVHFPIALFLVGVAFDWLAQWKKNAALASAAYYNLLVAAVSTLPVVATGTLAWRWQLEGARLKGNLLFHLILGTVSSLLIWHGLVASPPGSPADGPAPAGLPSAGGITGCLNHHSYRPPGRLFKRY